jgi:hypothetical protein
MDNVYVGNSTNGTGGVGIQYQDVHSIELDRARKDVERLTAEIKTLNSNIAILKDVIQQIISGMSDRY